MIEEKRNPASSNGGNTGYREGGTYIYTKNLELNEKNEDETFILQFDGVYSKAFVFVNGQLAGKNLYGYSTFYVNLTDFLIPNYENEIRVQVKTGDQPNSRWYTGTGIYRDVYLLTGNKMFISPDDVQAKTEYYNESTATLALQTKIVNNTDKGRITIKTKIADPKGNIVAQSSSPTVLFSNQKKK
jgi:Beta-galactosidase/beta-glucuronidase